MPFLLSWARKRRVGVVLILRTGFQAHCQISAKISSLGVDGGVEWTRRQERWCMMALRLCFLGVDLAPPAAVWVLDSETTPSSVPQASFSPKLPCPSSPDQRQ